MAINKFKRIASFAAVFLFLFGSINYIFMPTAYAVPSDVKTKDENRRKLHASLRCLDGAIIDDDDEIRDFNDMFDKRRWAGADQFGWEAEIAIYGIDLTSNGVVECKTALSAALTILGEESGEIGILKALTNNKRSDFSVGFPGSEINYTDLKTRITKKRDELRTQLLDTKYYDYLLRQRISGLIDVCYDVDGPPIERSNLGGRDFAHEINGDDVNFYYKGDNNIRGVITTNNRGWYNDDGEAGRPTRIGDIQLSAGIGDEGPLTDDAVHPDEDGFYPMGDDRDILNNKTWGQNDGSEHGIQTTMGLQACNLVKENADWIFERDWKVNDSGISLVDPVSGEVDPNNGTVGGGSAADEDSCESSSGGFGWLLCAGINLLATAIDRYENIIRDQLEVVTPGSEIEEAWSRVRTIALILLVPIMLVMVISTALGFEFIDAYTVKRALPRLAIAVILITLSFGLTKFAIDVFNTLGTGIQGIMLQPFGGEKSLNEIVSTGAGVTFNATTGLVATGAFFAGIGTGVLFPLILSAAIGIFLGFVVLIIRQVLLFFLIIVAPVAIVAWILPGTEKFWKLWWGNFSKLLFMFPLIMALLAAGNIAATIIPEQQGSTNALTFILILIAFVAPFFFIPATFKAGGAFFGALAGATMGALANQRKGLRDRANASRQEGWQRFKTGTGRGRLRNSNLVRRAGMGVGVGARGRFGFGATGRAARSQLGQVVSDENLKNNARLQKLAFDDDGNAVMALSGGTRAGAEQAAQELLQGWQTTLRASDRYQGATEQEQQDMEAALVMRRNQALAAASAVGFTRANAQSALSTLAQNKSRSVAAGAAGRTTIQHGIDRLHGNNRVAADEQEQNFAYTSNQAGRADLGGSNWNSRSQGGVSDSSLLGLERSSVAQGASGHENGIIAARADAEAMWATGNEEDMDRVATHLLELDAMLPYTTGPTRQEVLESRQRLAGVREYAEARVAAGAIAPRRYERAPGDGGDPPLTPPAGGGGGAGGP